jgi:L-arabinose isomerase
VSASVVQIDSRFRMIVNEIDVVPPDEPLPKLPVARAVWVPRPDLRTAAAAWIYAGGAHHTGFSQALATEHLQDFADMADMELLCIDADTSIRRFRNELRWNEAAWILKRGY